jgi:hypothetical protein
MAFGFKFERPCLSAGKALRYFCASQIQSVMTNSKTLTIRVSAVRTRKPAKKAPDSEAKEFTKQLLNLLHSPQIGKLSTPDLFVSVIASAIEDLS